MILAGDLTGFHINERSNTEVQTPNTDPTILVPLAPIHAYLERIGGLSELPGIGVRRTIEIEKAPYTREVVERTLDEARQYRRARKAIEKLREQAKANDGKVDLHKADAFCCEILSVHPIEVYGMAWFEPEVEVETEELVA